MAERVLVVEDDASIARGLVTTLVDAGYDVQQAGDARTAIELARRSAPAVALLDLGLPDADGLDVCRALRRLVPSTRIVIITARTEEADIVVGLDAGADDYLVKPFRLAELLARVRAQLRRPDAGNTDAVTETIGGITIDRSARRVYVAGDEVELRPKEYDLLSMLLSEAGAAVTRERIMETVWDEHWFGSTKTLDMHVSALRRKLAHASGTITTLRHVGYRFDA